ELLSREGEIAIAKRIEAGRDTMIRGLCESALTFEAIMVWRQELAEGRILLREVIDLDQTYIALNPDQAPENQQPGHIPGQAPKRPEPGSDDAAKAKDGEEKAEGEDEDEDDFDDGGGLSISAMEAELRVGVMEILDAVAGDFGAFRKLQDKLVEARLRGEDLSPKDRKTYDGLNTA